MIDEYDAQHPETGSSNISKATPEWTAVLEEARRNYDGVGYVLHDAYAIVSEQVKAGIPWFKCMNCGSPYRADREGASVDSCSPQCWGDYLSYLDNSLEGMWDR